MEHFEKVYKVTSAVLGMGVYCPLGTNCSELEKKLLEQKDSIRTVRSFDGSCFLSDKASAFSVEIDGGLSEDEVKWMDRATLLATRAFYEALEDSGLNLKNIDPERIAVCLGSSHSGLMRTEDVAKEIINNSINTIDRKIIASTLVSHCTAVIKRLSGAQGRVMTVSSACASSNTAIGIASSIIERGEADVVITGGADTVSISVMSGFNVLCALAPQKTSPFGEEVGLSIGEGAGIMVLARDDLVEGNTRYHGRVLGYGLSGDAHHATAPDQDGVGAANAINAALENASIKATEIGYINAHGTGTEANDRAESKAIARLFGNAVPISSTKSYYGHTLGASGVIEAISTILLAKHGKVPASLRLDKLREGVEHLNFAKSDTTINPNANLLINNFGFGGNNSSLLLKTGRYSKYKEQLAINFDEVVITGVGACSAAGLGCGALQAALEQGQLINEADKTSDVYTTRVGPVRFQTLDLKKFSRAAPSTKYALIALKEALGSNAEYFADNLRAGLIGGAIFGAQKPTEKFMESVFLGNPALANAHYFPMIVMNATAGVASQAYQIKGYNTTICGSASALTYAADIVSEDRQDRAAVIAGDEVTKRLETIYCRAGIISPKSRERIGRLAGRSEALGEFGGAVTIERRSVAQQRGTVIFAHLRGWATRQDPIDLSIKKSGAALIRAQKVALEMASLDAKKINNVLLLDTGLAPVKRAVHNALKITFDNKLPPLIRPASVLGYAPSSGPLMTVIAGLNLVKGITMATGYDATGESFAFIFESVKG